MSATVLVCGKVFDGVSEKLTGPAEILVEGNRIASIGRSVDRSSGVQVIDLSDRTVTPGFIDTHVHLTMDAANLVQQTLESSASKALKGLSLAREYMSYGFTTLRDLGTADPEWPTVDLRNAINAGFVDGPRLIVAAHILSASAGHGDLRGFYNPRWGYPSQPPPMIPEASGHWCGVSTRTAATGSKPQTRGATSALVTIRRA